MHSDLDNTLIYSYRHDIGNNKINVECYQKKQLSFVTIQTQELLRAVSKKMLIVPTTTRTVEQYNRIDLGIGSIKYALVCNGGVLLMDGIRNEEWYRESLSDTAASVPELKKAEALLAQEKRRKFELRFIENLFIFTKCSEPDAVVSDLKPVLDQRLVDVFHIGEKVYVIPVTLNKGRAVERFRAFLHSEFVIAAGDSEFDIPMLKAADKGFVPFGFREQYPVDFAVEEAVEQELFSEWFLKVCSAY